MKYKGKVKDYSLRTGFIVLCFRSKYGWRRDTILTTEANEYLTDKGSNSSFEELHNTKDLNERLNILTEIYRSVKKIS